MPRSFVIGAVVRHSGRWLGLTMAIIALAGWGLSLGRPARAAGDCSVSDADVALDGDEQAMLSGINAYRQQKGLTPLAVSPALSRSAAWMSNDMARKNYFSHTDSLGRDPFTRMADCGYTVATTKGENLAASVSGSAMALALWQNSPEHNANLLEPRFHVAGIARNGGYWTLDLGGVSDSGAAIAPPNSTPTTGTSAAAGTGAVSISVSLVTAGGQPLQSDRSGYVFTLTGNGTTLTASTNAQGQAALSVPAGSYTITQQPRAGTSLVSITGNGPGGGASVTVTAGQMVLVTATYQVAAAATATPIPTPIPTTTPAPTAPPAATAAPAGPTASPTPAVESVPLVAGCNNVALTWPAGTALSTVAAAITGGELEAIWHWDGADGRYQAFSPIPGAPDDYNVTLARADVVFICTKAQAVLIRPAI